MLRLLPLIFLLPSLAWATDFYLRPAGGSYGTEDGSSYANAFDGVSNVAGVGSSDTLYVCGTHYEELAISTTGYTVDGNCPDDPGIFDGSEDMLGTASSTWTDQGSNVWRRTGATQAVVYGLWINGLTGIRNTTGPVAAGQWDSDSSNEIRIYSTSDPATAYSSIRAGVTRDGVSMTSVTTGTIKNLSFQNFAQSRSLGAYSGTNNQHYHKQGAVYVKTSSGVTIQDIDCDYVHQCVTATETNSDITVSGVSFRNSGAQTTTSISGTSGIGVHIIADGCDVSGVDFDGSHTLADNSTVSASGIGILSAWIIDLAAGSDCAIHDNTIRNFGSFGIFISDLKDNKSGDLAADIQIYSNDIRTSYTEAQTGSDIGDADCIGVGGDSGGDYSTDIVTGINTYANYCSGATNAGIHYSNYMGKGSTISGNIVVASATDEGSAAQAGIKASNGATVINNIIYGVPGLGHGIRMGDSASHPSPGTNYVINNIVMDQEDATRNGYTCDAGATCERYSNISYNNADDEGGTWSGDALLTSQPEFLESTPTLARHFKPLTGGNIHRAGSIWKSNQDKGNRRFHYPPSIGAWEAADGDIATARTAATTRSARQ